MKYSELKRWLRKEGCYCDHEGGNQDRLVKENLLFN